MAAAGTAAIKFASESQDAYKQFAAATGTATENLGKYQDMINNVYKDNFGESIGDVADAMAKVDQNMSYLDDSALQRCTEYAYTLADTFDVDIGESTRAADSLIKNFGVSAREAFNLMAQGAQNGLDFSGELFDNIDEYSVQFQKLGLDAEDMFSIFANGAENGAFNLDKIGDAVKEFSIRAIDGSDTTKQGFEAIGMNADKMAKRFAAGGQDAKAAFNEVIQGLAGMEDPVAQSAAGVNLFGTMWEDLGPQVITTLSTTNGAIDETKETMEECDRGRGCCRNNPERSSQKLYSWEKQASCEGGTDMHVKVNYPDAVMQIREIKCSVKAGDIIGEKLENHIQELDDNITVKESRKSGIERRERILNIQPSSSSDLETRKIAVIARWCISTMYTERILQKRLQSMLGDGYNLEVNIQQKTVSVTLQLKHYKNRKVIWEMLEGIVPLDQIIDVIIIYNTYRAYKPFTYKELKVKTYDQLRTEVIQ